MNFLNLMFKLFAWTLSLAEPVGYFIYRLLPRRWQLSIEKYQELYSFLSLLLMAGLFSGALFLFSHFYTQSSFKDCQEKGGRWDSQHIKCYYHYEKK